MAAVEDLPRSDNEDDDEEEDEDDYDDDDDEDTDDEEASGSTNANADAGPSEPSQPLDEAAFQAQMAARLEAIRLSKALGNDEPEDGIQQDEDASSDEESDSDEDSDAESDGGQSIAAQTDYTTYQRAPKTRKPRVAAKQLGQKDLVRAAVEGEMRAKGANGRSTGGASSKVGKAKGHKWKSSEKYLVGKDSGW